MLSSCEERVGLACEDVLSEVIAGKTGKQDQ
jgi:hypothetical protein